MAAKFLCLVSHSSTNPKSSEQYKVQTYRDMLVSCLGNTGVCKELGRREFSSLLIRRFFFSLFLEQADLKFLILQVLLPHCLATAGITDVAVSPSKLVSLVIFPGFLRCSRHWVIRCSVKYLYEFVAVGSRDYDVTLS